jgi:hypothetical protein
MAGFGTGRHYKRHSFTVLDIANIVWLSVWTINKHAREGVVDLDNLASVIEYIKTKTK